MIVRTACSLPEDQLNRFHFRWVCIWLKSFHKYFFYFAVGRFFKEMTRWVSGEFAYKKSAWCKLETYLFSSFYFGCLVRTSRIKCFNLSGWLSRLTVFPVKQDKKLLLLRRDMSHCSKSESACQCQNEESEIRCVSVLLPW